MSEGDGAAGSPGFGVSVSDKWPQIASKTHRNYSRFRPVSPTRNGDKKGYFYILYQYLMRRSLSQKSPPEKASFGCVDRATFARLRGWPSSFRRRKNVSARPGISGDRADGDHSDALRRALLRAAEQERARARAVFRRAEYLSRLGAVRHIDFSRVGVHRPARLPRARQSARVAARIFRLLVHCRFTGSVFRFRLSGQF